MSVLPTPTSVTGLSVTLKGTRQSLSRGKRKSGIQIEDNPRTKQSNNVLTFSGVEKEDAGMYWCTGENEFSYP